MLLVDWLSGCRDAPSGIARCEMRLWMRRGLWPPVNHAELAVGGNSTFQGRSHRRPAQPTRPRSLIGAPAERHCVIQRPHRQDLVVLGRLDALDQIVRIEDADIARGIGFQSTDRDGAHFHGLPAPLWPFGGWIVLGIAGFAKEGEEIE